MHPFNEHRDHHKQKSRVGHIVHGYAHGGGVHPHDDEAEDMAMIRREVKPSALKHRKAHKAEGGAVAARQDRVARARGGRTKHGKGHTSVNVIVAPQGGHPGAAPMPMPMHPPMPPAGGVPGPGPAPAPAAMPPRPPMMPPGGAPGMMAPPGMGPRRNGGRATYARGGGVKDGPAYKEGIRNGTHVSNNPTGKNDLQNLHRGKPVTYKTGGPVEAPKKMGPKFKGGAGGGAARVEKGRRANRDYLRA